METSSRTKTGRQIVTQPSPDLFPLLGRIARSDPEKRWQYPIYISHVYQFKTYFAKHRVMGQSWLRANSYRIHVTTASTDKGTAPVRHHIKWAVPNHEIFPQKTAIK